MVKIVTVDEMRAIEQASDAQGHSYADMMQLAGRAVAERVMQIVRGIHAPRVTILVGPGNNGGDGLVVGRILAQEVDGCVVSAFILKMRDESDAVFVDARDAGVTLVDLASDKANEYETLQGLVAGADVVVDALFGTSLRLPVRGDASKVLQTANASLAARRAQGAGGTFSTPADPDETAEAGAPVVIAVDCPSGVDCDTGETDKHAIPADETVTFAAVKPGLLTFPGAELVGTLHVGDIGLPTGLPELDDVALTLVDAPEVRARLPLRPRNSHKGTYGKAMIVAGSLNFTGAAYLAAAAAYRVGAGLVTGAAPQIIIPVLASMLPEATWLLLPHDMGVVNEAAVRVLRKELDGYTAMLLGPGFGREDVTREFLRELLRPTEEIRRSRAIGFVPGVPAGESESDNAALPPLVIDADALNLLAGMDDWTSLVPPGSILTPHPGEFGRLAGLDTVDVQADRVALARDRAAAWNCVVVLKGAFTVVAAPDGRTAIQPFASAALAKAGTGDVLAGAIAGLLAQGIEPFDAALAGAWLHGVAGQRAAAMLGTTASVTAGDVLDMLPDAVAAAHPA